MTEPSRAVFLSYASQDAEAAARICASLRAAGIEVWFDQNELRGGHAWDQMIRQQIRDCALFVQFLDTTGTGDQCDRIVVCRSVPVSTGHSLFTDLTKRFI